MTGIEPPSDGQLEIELRELRYFVAVAEELSFTRAAQRLHIAQLALSSAIRGLEERLGGELLHRTTRHVALTAAGAALLPRARETLASARAAVATTRDALSGVTGRLRLGVARPAAHPFGEVIIAAMAEHAPGITRQVTPGFLPPLLDGLAGGELDAVVAFCSEEDARFATLRLSDEPAIAVVFHTHRLAGRASVRLEELRDDVLVQGPPEIARGWNAAVLRLFREHGLEPRSTVQSLGFLLPPGHSESEVVGVTTAVAADLLPVPYDVVRIPIAEHTLPFDLVWRVEDSSPAPTTLRAAAERTARSAEWSTTRARHQ